MKRLVQLPSPAGTQSAGEVTLDLPAGTYYDLFLSVVSGTVSAANFSSITVEVNNKTIIRVNGDTLDNYMQRFGDTAFSATSPLRIPLRHPNRRLHPSIRNRTALVIGPRSPLKTARLRFDVSAAVTPNVAVRALMDDPRDSTSPDMALVPRMSQVVQGLINGEAQWFSLPYGTPETRWLWAVQIDGGIATDTTRLRVIAGPQQAEIHNLTRNENLKAETVAGLTNVAALNYVYDRSILGEDAEALDTMQFDPGARQLMFAVTHNAAVDATVLTHSYGVI